MSMRTADRGDLIVCVLPASTNLFDKMAVN